MTGFILALLPIIWLMIALLVLKIEGYKACLAAAVIAAVLSVVCWDEPASYTAASALEGILNALWPICLVIIAALFTYDLTVETGAMEKIRKMLSGVSKDERILFLLIGWGFGNFMEGMAGFGTAVAIPAGILVALGFDPVRTVAACLVVNSMPTAFGSVGVPTETLSAVTGISTEVLCPNISVIETVLFLVSPFLMLIIFGGGLKALKGVMGITFISAIAFIIPETLASFFLGPQLPDVLGAVCSIICVLLYVRFHEKEDMPEIDIKAWSPFIFVMLLLFVVNLIPLVKETLSYVRTELKIYPGDDSSPLTFLWLNTPGVIMFAGSIIGGAVQGASPLLMGKVLLGTLRKNVKTVVTVCSVLACARIMDHSGMTGDIAGMLSGTGRYFPLVSPLIGVIGAFITGSGTSTSVLFGGMQVMTAKAIGASPAWLASANIMGAGIGKMISPQCIAVGSAAAGISGSESVILKKVMKYCVLYCVVAGILCYLLPFIISV